MTVAVASRTVASFTDAETAEFTLARRDWFVHTVRSGRRPVLVAPETTSVSVGTLVSLRAAGGDWLLAGPTGLHSLGGVPAEFPGWQIPAALGPSPPHAPTLSSESAARPVSAVQLVTSVHRRAEASTTLGSSVARVLGGDLSWGLFEPCTRPWDAGAVTELVRRRMPNQTRLFARGERGSAAVTVRRSQFGVVEEMKAVLPLMPHERGEETLRALAETEDVLLASAWSCIAREDGTLGSELGQGLRPLGFAVGPRVLRRSGWTPDVAGVSARWVGQRARQRSLVVDLTHASDRELAAVAADAMDGTPLAGLWDGALQ